ncbi:HTH domain-containing protein [Cetobacterium sp. 8H]|uniref:HTH domain-containing protein n=1 Tax=Cetobacterium sp. 8H TaxID=2759681 RepID=UPI00163CDB0A|nr:HTH domain-containing protein [Cetobacterium sp. 8H]MBC2852192.1 HTH domain-containing protein [Cetobacterium sp. 8H]
MNLTSFHFKIIYCLTVDSYTIEELANIFNVSHSNIRVCIKQIEILLDKKTIFGIHNELNENPNLKDRLKEMQRLTCDERRVFIILSFLINECVNLSELSKKLKVTRRTISKDIVEIKKVLSSYNLTIEGINSIGVILVGDENKKREIFKLYLFKIYYEKKYLPKEFLEFFNYFQVLKVKYDVDNSVQKILSIRSVLYQSFVILKIEILFIIAIVRQKYKMDYDSENILEKFKDIFKKAPFLSEYEVMDIQEDYSRKDINDIFENSPEKIEIVKNLIMYLNKNLPYKFEISKETLIHIAHILIIMDYKKKFNIKEFYSFNKKTFSLYMEEFHQITFFLRKYFNCIDSFDETSIATTLINSLHLEMEKRIENLNNIVVVYRFLQKPLLKSICKELGLEKIIKNENYISIYDFDNYCKYNKINGILIFEDIEITNSEYKIVSFNFPVSKMDYIKIKDLLK